MRTAGTLQSFAFTALLAGAIAIPLHGEPRPADAIVGEWRGTSLCTNRELAPACKDESIIYVFTPLPSGGVPRVHLDASKIVDGKVLPMGEFDLDYDADEASWNIEFSTPRVHARWSYSVSGDRLDGTLVELPSKAQLRKVEATRQAPPK